MGEAPPLARSPITPAPPVVVAHGWQVSGRRSRAALRISDCTPLAKVRVLTAPGGQVARALGAGHGRAERDTDGVLVVGSDPGEWLLLAPPGAARAVVARMEGLADTGLVTVQDDTSGRALLRITGASAAAMLSKVCAIDLSDGVTPNGTAFRSSVAKLVTDVVRDDRAGERSYLLGCERSYGQYLFDALVDAGDEFGIDVDGFPGV